MTTMFWILWFFIAFVVVLVALTLRQESSDMPRREILRAVESTGKMGFAERLFLWVFSWLDTRFRLQDYWNMSKGASEVFPSFHSLYWSSQAQSSGFTMSLVEKETLRLHTQVCNLS
jgi:hypothetical protein